MSNYPKLTAEKSLHVGSWDPTHLPPQPPPDIPGLTTINGPCWYGAGLVKDHGWVKKIERHDKSLVGIVPPTEPRYDTLGSVPAQRSAWPNTGEWYGPLADAVTISKQGNPLIGQKFRYNGVGIRVNANAHKIESKDLNYFISEQEIHLIADKLKEGSDFILSDDIPRVKIKLSNSEGKIFGKAPEKIEFVAPKVDLVDKRGGQSQPLYVGGNAYFDHPNIGDLSQRFNLADARPKPFDMVHPSLGDGNRLRYACIEGPEVGVYFRGRIKNETEIELPWYWKDLVHVESISVQLQPVGSFQNIIVKNWDENKVYLESENNTSIDCFYHVYAERKDVNSLVVEYTGESWNDYPDPNYDSEEYKNKINTPTT